MKVDEILNLHRPFVEWAEARRQYPYEDSVGKLTIGVGRNLEDRGLSEDEIDYLLSNDQKSAYEEAESFPWFKDLSPVRAAIVVDMIFNMGISRFSGFVKTIEALQAGNWMEAAKEMQDSRWYRQTGRRAQALVRAMATNTLEY